jgi:hypothetical protein
MLAVGCDLIRSWWQGITDASVSLPLAGVAAVVGAYLWRLARKD